MKIAVVGSYGVGMTMRVATMPAPGETVSGGAFSTGPGGKGSNQAIAAARLGADVCFLTAVGADAFAEEARNLWMREGVTADQIVTGTQATMVGFILVDATGENRIIIASGALEELYLDHVEAFRQSIREADMLIVSMEIPMPAVTAALRIASEEGTTSLLNPAPASLLPEEAWKWIDIITPNQSEAPVLLGLESSHGYSNFELVEQLRKRTQATIVLTLGSEGALVDDGTLSTIVPPIAASQVVDTTGAGDSFTAALSVALVEGQPLASAVQFAAAAGSHAVTIEGVIDSLPTREHIHNLIGNS
jgi:ribokinase